MEYDVHPSDGLADDLNDDGIVLGEKTGTVADRNAMTRLGKEQLFKVRHNQGGGKEL